MRAAESALNLERGRLQKLKELEEANQSLILSSNMVLLSLVMLSFEISCSFTFI